METVPCTRCSGTGQVPTPRALRRAREKSGLSIGDLARRSGLSAVYLSLVERGKRGVTARVAEIYLALEG